MVALDCLYLVTGPLRNRAFVCRYSSAGGGFGSLVPSDRAVTCSDKPLRNAVFGFSRLHGT